MFSDLSSHTHDHLRLEILVSLSLREWGSFWLLKNGSHVPYNYLPHVHLKKKKNLVKVRYYIKTPSSHIRHNLTETDGETKISTFGKV